ncbi:MAG TPA: hypothetical protein VGX48_17815 [Pyrinomonadaceae bacterium]|nr:hypothetical protein [Pyrinomonadaceae bacterium]
MSAPQFTPPVGARRVFLIMEDEPLTFELVDEEKGGAEAAPPSSVTRSSDDSLTLLLTGAGDRKTFAEALADSNREAGA